MKKCLLLILLSGLFCAAFAQNEQNTPASIANNGKVWASLYAMIPIYVTAIGEIMCLIIITN